VGSIFSEHATWIDAGVIGDDSGQVVDRFAVDVIDRYQMVVIDWQCLRPPVDGSSGMWLAGT
jgi:hypothetical protein